MFALVVGFVILAAMMVLLSGIGIAIHVAHKSNLERRKAELKSEELQQMRRQNHEMEMARLREESSDNDIDRTLKLHESGIRSEVVEARVIPASKQLPSGVSSNGYVEADYSGSYPRVRR